MAELADASDSKSDVHWTCGFKSRSGYSFSHRLRLFLTVTSFLVIVSVAEDFRCTVTGLAADEPRVVRLTHHGWIDPRTSFMRRIQPVGSSDSRRTGFPRQQLYPGQVGAGSTLNAMVGSRIERQLADVGKQLKALRSDLGVAEQALMQVDYEADDARLRSLVSETPLAQKEHEEARRQVDVNRRNRDGLHAEVVRLEVRQDELLDAFNER